MKCKDCKDVVCMHRSSDAEMECVLQISNVSDNYEIVKNCGLRFDNGRIYKIEEHQKPGKYPYEVKVDVTDEIKQVLKGD